MSGNFYIYFDLQKKQEIIKYRKLKEYFVVDTNDSDILDYYNINEDTNPYHIINKSEFKNTDYNQFIVKRLLVDYDTEYDILTQPIGTLLLDFVIMRIYHQNTFLESVRIHHPEFSNFKKLGFYGIVCLTWVCNLFTATLIRWWTLPKTAQKEKS